jgi:hypothetical protein
VQGVCSAFMVCTTSRILNVATNLNPVSNCSSSAGSHNFHILFLDNSAHISFVSPSAHSSNVANDKQSQTDDCEGRFTSPYTSTLLDAS